MYSCTHSAAYDCNHLSGIEEESQWWHANHQHSLRVRPVFHLVHARGFQRANAETKISNAARHSQYGYFCCFLLRSVSDGWPLVYRVQLIFRTAGYFHNSFVQRHSGEDT